jgi:hypothetical protein
MGSTPGRLCNIVQRMINAYALSSWLNYIATHIGLTVREHNSLSVDADTRLACCLHVRGSDFKMRSGCALPHFAGGSGTVKWLNPTKRAHTPEYVILRTHTIMRLLLAITHLACTLQLATHTVTRAHTSSTHTIRLVNSDKSG